MFASPSRSYRSRILCRTIVLSNEHRPRSFCLSSLHRSCPMFSNCLYSAATSNRAMTSMAMAICRRVLPIHRLLHDCKAFAVVCSLLSSTTNGLPAAATELQASVTVSKKPSTLGQKLSNLNRLPRCNSAYGSTGSGNGQIPQSPWP